MSDHWKNFHGPVSTIKTDPGYNSFRFLAAKYKIRAFLNGVEILDVYSADPNEGFIKRPKLSPSGRFVVVGDQIETETLRGRVEIKLEPRKKEEGNPYG